MMITQNIMMMIENNNIYKDTKKENKNIGNILNKIY